MSKFKAELVQIINRLVGGSQRLTGRDPCPDPETPEHAARMREALRRVMNALRDNTTQTRERDVRRRQVPGDTRWEAKLKGWRDEARTTGKCAITGTPVRARGSRGPCPSYAPGAQDWVKDVQRAITLARSTKVRKALDPPECTALKTKLLNYCNTLQGTVAAGGGS